MQNTLVQKAARKMLVKLIASRELQNPLSH
jgi:hypothetical protein